MTSRGTAVSAYIPAFSKGAKIYGANVQSGVITSAHIADGTVVAGEIGALAVTSAKLANNQITSAKLRMQTLTGSVANSGVVYSLSHTLGKVPSIVLFEPRGTVSMLKGVSTSAGLVGHPTVSAHTSAKIYYAGSKNASFRAYIIV